MSKSEMMRKLAAVFMAILFLSACGSPDELAKWSAEKAVAARLKDPTTARFGSEFVVRKAPDKNGTEWLATCGTVDGKNSFGAYTGGSRFVALQSANKSINSFDTYFVTIDDGDRRAALGNPLQETVFERVNWNANCVDAEHPPTHTAAMPEN